MVAAPSSLNYALSMLSLDFKPSFYIYIKDFRDL